jgi:parvulin-like peptidyl-prolyl isomerase
MLLILLACLTWGAACQNGSGERGSMWEWLRPGGDSEETGDSEVKADSEGMKEKEIEPDDRVAAADAVSGGDLESGPGPSTGAIHSDALLVNGETIRVADILEPILPVIEQQMRGLPPAAYYERVGELVRQQIVEVVAQQLIWRRAEGEIAEETQPRIDKAVEKMEKERINREFNGSETRYQKYLAGRGKTRSEVRQRLRRSIIIDNYLREHLLSLVAAPRKPELMRYYTAHEEEFSSPAEREMLLIDSPVAAFVDGRKVLTEERRQEAAGQARQAIEDAAEALQAGESFEDVVQRYSHGVNKKKGGAWGFISRPLRGRWAKPSKRLFELSPSEISEIIESADSFFIVKLGQIRGGQVVSFQEAQPQITQRLRQQRFAVLRGEFLQKELKESTIGSLEAFTAEVLKVIPGPVGG